MARSYHTGNAGCERRQRGERNKDGVLGELFLLFDNEVSGPARGHGQGTAVPIGYINSTYYCSLLSNKITHNG